MSKKLNFKSLFLILTSTVLIFSTVACSKTETLYSKENPISEPSKFDVFWHTCAANTVLSSFYSEYFERIPLQGSEKVLDFGAGWGTTTEILSKRLNNGGEITFLDISKKWLNAAKKKLAKCSNVKYLLGDITTLDIADNSFDVIIIHFVLHDIDSVYHRAIIEKQVKVLKTGGKIYFREPLMPERSISPQYIENIMKANGLTKQKLEKTVSFWMGEMLEGVFVKE